MTLVTIIIPCYNASLFIENALSSVLVQSHSDIECLIVDDCSEDNSKEIVERLSFGDTRVRLIRQKENMGASSARNVGIAEARGAYVTFLDADDAYEKNRIELLLGLANSTDADIVVDNQSVRWFPNGTHTFEAFPFLSGHSQLQLTQELFFANAASSIRSLSVGFMKPMYRRAFLERERIRFDTNISVGEDFCMLARAVVSTQKFFGHGDPTYIYYRRRGSLSFSKKVPLAAMATDCEALLTELKPLLSQTSQNLLYNRVLELNRMSDWGNVVEDIRAGRLISASTRLLKHPTLIGEVPKAAVRFFNHQRVKTNA